MSSYLILGSLVRKLVADTLVVGRVVLRLAVRARCAFLPRCLRAVAPLLRHYTASVNLRPRMVDYTLTTDLENMLRED